MRVEISLVNCPELHYSLTILFSSSSQGLGTYLHLEGEGHLFLGYRWSLNTQVYSITSLSVR
jgi:hypothetical protein